MARLVTVLLKSNNVRTETRTHEYQEFHEASTSANARTLETGELVSFKNGMNGNQVLT